MEKNLLTVVTATYNSEKTLERTIESLLNQTYSKFEYIIIDGLSNDKTIEIIKKYEKEFLRKQINYTWVSERDEGIYDAFNKGVKLAKGKWISFLGSDDYYIENALELYNNEISNLKSQVDIIHSIVKVEERKLIYDEWTWKNFKKSMNIAHVGAFHNKLFFETYGEFNINYGIAGDYEILLRANQNLKTHWFNTITAIMGDKGVSNNQVIKVYRETTKAKLENKSRHVILIKLDHYIWVVKYKIKRILNAWN